MHCIACDCNLSDFESTRKNANTGEYLDMCNHCFDEISSNFVVIEREDLKTSEEAIDWNEESLEEYEVES